MSFAALSQNEAQNLMNVTAASLARYAGVVDNTPGNEEGTSGNMRLLKMQLGILQSQPSLAQKKIYHEVAATYLPKLFEQFLMNDVPLSPPMVMLNLITATPYFARFLTTDPAAPQMLTFQAKRMVGINRKDFSVDEIAELGQWFCTLLALQGSLAEIPDDAKDALVPTFQSWMRQPEYRGRLAAEVAGRCWGILTGDVERVAMAGAMRRMLVERTKKCALQSCLADKPIDGPNLLRCARCKTALYCGRQHQKQHWTDHKVICFTPRF